MAFLDYYEILSVPPTATLEQIERAYKLLAKMSHPDAFPKDARGQAWANERMKQIHEAYDVLKDPGKRAAHDRERTEHQASTGSNQRNQQQQRQQYREPRVRCPLCEAQGKISCLTCQGQGDWLCPGCEGAKVVVCPVCRGTGSLTATEYERLREEVERARHQAEAQAARQEAEAATQRRVQEARQAVESRRRIVLAGVGVLCLLFVARSCTAPRPSATSSRSWVPEAQPTPYRPFVPPTPERARPRPTLSPPPLRSKHDLTPTQVTFRNETRNPINVLWINYEGREVPYRTLDPGDSYRQPTFASHPWRLRDAMTGRILRTMVAGTTPSHVVVGQLPQAAPSPRRASEPSVGPLPTIDPPGSAALRRGIELYRARRYSEALAEFQSAAQGGPDQDEAWAWLGMSNVALGQTTQALAAFRRSVELNPQGRQADLAQQWIAKLEASAATPAPPTQRGPTIQSLTELSPILQLQTAFPGGGTLLGQPYRFAVIHANRSGFMARTAYHLNGQYDRFEVTVGMEASGKLLQQAAAKVFGDGELLFESPSLGLGQPPVKVSVSVRGVTRLELQSTGLPVVWTIIWADPRLIKD